MDFAKARKIMLASQIERRGVKDRLVLDAMRDVPRHRFVPAEYQEGAYADGPLPIGQGQTISQPYMVAMMTEALQLRGGETVLEVGTGSGYQSAVLAKIAGQVYSIERHAELADRAKGVLSELGYKNIHIVVGDGTLGLADKGPFDAIIVTAGAPHIPTCLKKQLKEGGRLLVPVGGQFMQSLTRVTRRGDHFEEERLLGCVFVPLIGEDGWAS
jgi:protein-L-isoaspartate(D-aspartate) O-methyltransferase